MDREALESFLGNFKAAWENRDPEAAVALFTEEATYATSPFQLAMVGRRAIRAFWNDVPRLQTEVSFSASPVAVESDVGVAHYWARFRRLNDDRRVEQDGMMMVRLDSAGLCHDLGLWAVARSQPAFVPPLR